MPGLGIQIDATTGQLSKSIAEAKADLVSFKSALEKATDTQTISKLNKAIKETEGALRNVKNLSPDFEKKLVPGANQAGSALTNLGRIASDAPFGFIAIQNNLDPLIQSFGYLTKEAGGVKGALTALKGSLLGAGGIALGFSIVSSLVTAVIQKYGSLGAAIDSLTGNSSAAAAAQRDMADAFAQAEGKAAGEIAQINALLTVARDNNLSKDAQGEAIKKLNSEYDKYLPKLTAENIGTKEVDESVKKLTDSLIRQAKIQGLKDLISKETAKQAEIFSKELSQSADAIDYLIAAVKGAGPAGNFFNELTFQGAKTATKNFTEAQKKIDEFTRSLVDLTTAEAKNGTLFNDPVIDQLKKRIAALKELQGLTGLSAKQQVELAQLEIQLNKRDAVKIGFTQQEVKEATQAILDKAFPSEWGNALHINTDHITVGIQAVKIAQPKPLTEGQVNDIAKATGLEKITIPETTIGVGKVNINPFGEMIGNAFADSLAILGESLGKSLADLDFAGGLKSAAQGILGILGDVLIQIGKQLIITSVLVQNIKRILSGLFGPGGGAAALALGVGLIATGALMKSIKFEGPKLADGGVLTQSTLINAGEAGKEVVMPLAKLPYLMNQGGSGGGGISVGLRIKDRDLIAFIDRGRQYSKRLG